MKRTLLTVLAVILLLSALVWGALAYRRYRSFQTPIPANTTRLVRINVDELILDIGWNTLWNPAYYSGEQADDPARSERDLSLDIGTKVPADLFLYQTDDRFFSVHPDVYLGSVALTDSGAFARTFVEWGMQPLAEAATLVSDRAMVVYNQQRAVFALSAAKLDTAGLANVLASAHQHSSIPVAQSPFKNIKTSDMHITLRGGVHASLHFDNGSMSFRTRQAWALPKAAPQNRPHFADTNTASFWMRGRFADMGTVYHIGAHTLHADSLLSTVSAEWKGTVIQHDTIVSYDYDENFEMQEIKETVEHPVPELYVTMAAPPTLPAYLKRQHIVADTVINPDVFPLYQVGLSPVAKGLWQFHTANPPVPPPAQHQHGKDQVLYLHINFNRVDPQVLPAPAAPYLQMLDILEINGTHTSGNEAVLQGQLRLKNQSINSLTQLIFYMAGR